MVESATLTLSVFNIWRKPSLNELESRRPRFGPADLAVGLGVLLLLYLAARVGRESFVSFHPPDILPHVSLDPRNLPNYAARSVLRMFLALIASTLFTLVYGYVAARNRRAEKVLIPLLDILQSVPVLGFLSITVTGFIALFPGSLLGLEAASVFAIFTGQAWNMTFSFYQSLRTVPFELDEMCTLYKLSRWERFTRLELPSATLGLVWNAMMSFGGGWFFLAASEAISVLNQSYTLPGLGSYVAAAVAQKNLTALFWAILTMVIVIVAIDQFFWRPLVTLADRYKLELSAGETRRFWLVDLWQTAQLPELISKLCARPARVADRGLCRMTAAAALAEKPKKASESDRVYDTLLVLVSIGLAVAAVRFVLSSVGIGEFGHAALLGLATCGRVVLLLVLSTIVWTPIGVAIGFSPKLARVTQPVVQVLSSFPANFVFPFATLAFLRFHIDINWGCILLMALGSQWYILFNVIGGAQGVPNDMREMAQNVGLRGAKQWRYVIGPAIFSSWVTGAITASGGAWNASIVSELVSWGDTTLQANGLGAYIADATAKGDWHRIVLGVGMMSCFVVGFNRTIWRRLYSLGETKYRLG
jgi:NitT/TauT family transport system permease protein